MKQAISIAILVLALGSAFYVLSGSDAIAPTPPEDVEEAGENGLFVYYFDMGKDCSTCLNLESYTHETLTTYFAAALADERIRWRVVDVDVSEHGHFVKDFGLYTKSVVLARYADGAVVEYENLSRIWELVYDKAAYMDYVREQVDVALGAQP